eukprot:CAMPEP_0175129058 /NCGR_PEP_ID=MMETSP0087-20121206/5264_1 /TAXON_ID=136419 /ORGANISM="Unknown Unknown, Strain D1" /LENGTH=620 /DNA_ID=CAMNT_0016411171 /DNA_START=42 /DNA_END=1901 /DNA_ORIENTATION=+
MSAPVSKWRKAGMRVKAVNRFQSKQQETVQIAKDLINQIKQRAKFTSLVSYSLKALKELASNDEIIADLFEHGVVDALVAIKDAHPNNENLTIGINNLLSHLCVTNLHAELIAESLGDNLTKLTCDTVVSSVAEDTIASSLALVNKLTDSKTVCRALVERGTIMDTMATVLEAAASESVAAAASQTLSKIIDQEVDETGASVASFIAKGGVDHILHAVKTFSHQRMMVQAGMCVLSKLKDSQEARQELKKHNALPVMSEILYAYSSQPIIKQATVSIVNAISTVSDVEQSVSASLDASASVKQQADAISNLSALSAVEAHAAVVADGQTMEEVLSIMQPHLVKDEETKTFIDSSSPLLLTHGANLLSRTANCKEHSEKIVALGGAKVAGSIAKLAVDSGSKSEHDAEMSASGIRALDKMLTCDTVDAIVSEEMPVVEAALEAFPESAAVTQAALSFFSGVATQAPHKLSSSSVEKVVACIHKHSSDPLIVQSAVTYLLGAYQTDSSLCSQAFDTAHGVGACLQVLDALTPSNDLLTRASAASASTPSSSHAARGSLSVFEPEKSRNTGVSGGDDPEIISAVLAAANMLNTMKGMATVEQKAAISSMLVRASVAFPDSEKL